VTVAAKVPPSSERALHFLVEEERRRRHERPVEASERELGLDAKHWSVDYCGERWGLHAEAG
jgi:hypothetical protein